jgi:hypothetical protein
LEFFKLTVESLNNFVKARTPSVTKPWKGTINKGPKDAPIDADTLARIAYRMRDIPPVADVLTLQDLGMQLTDTTRKKALIQLPSLIDASEFVGPLELIDDLAAASADVSVFTRDEEWTCRLP